MQRIFNRSQRKGGGDIGKPKVVEPHSVVVCHARYLGHLALLTTTKSIHMFTPVYPQQSPPPYQECPSAATRQMGKETSCRQALSDVATLLLVDKVGVVVSPRLRRGTGDGSSDSPVLCRALSVIGTPTVFPRRGRPTAEREEFLFRCFVYDGFDGYWWCARCGTITPFIL